MRVPVSWLAEYVSLPFAGGSRAAENAATRTSDGNATLADLTHRLTMLGLKLERLETVGRDVTGPLVVGRVLAVTPETHSNGKTVRWCQVDVGDNQTRVADPGPHQGPHQGSDQAEQHGQGIVCGADNFDVGDLVVVALPGAVLPGGFEIAARRTYGHVSDGMICSARELELGDDHEGILVLEADSAKPGEDAREVLHLVDEVIEFEIAPDRGYALSVRGVARESCLALSTSWQDPADLETPRASGDAYPVVVDDAAGCPLFAARVVRGIDPSRRTPRWMARRLQLAGMRPRSLAIDITNYVMLELGQPIHGYNLARLTGPIRVRRATDGESVTTLDGVRRTLEPDDLLIADDSGAIGIAGVMGGATTELGSETTDVVIEAAHFAPASISRTARRHHLPSEASKRFERGVDPALPPYAAQRVADLLVEYAGGTVEPGITYVGEPPLSPTIDMPAALSRDVVGLPISDDQATEALRAVGCVVRRGGDRLRVVPPSWRPDLVDPYDLVEEVARLAGYDTLPSVVPAAPPGLGLTPGQQRRRRIGRALAGIGLVEVSTAPFVGDAAWDALGYPESDLRRRAIRIANPLSDEEPFLATSLLPGLLTGLARNVSRGADDVALFEMASVFLPDAEPTAAPILEVARRPSDHELDVLFDAVPSQPLYVATAFAGRRERAGWWGAGRKADWADAVFSMLEVGRVAGVELGRTKAEQPPWHPGRCAALTVSDVVVGHAGELHPRVCTALDLPARSCAAEIDLSALLGAAPERVSAVPFSIFPVAKEDVAVIVGRDVTAGAVGAALREGAGPLCESVRLFDVYAGEQVPAGEQSLAFALRFRAPDRTLTDGEIKAARDAAVEAAARQTGARWRS